MAISTYTELNDAVENWLDRTDLTARIPEFIDLAEASFNRIIRQPEMITKDDAYSISGQYTTLPTDYLEITRIVITSVTPVITLEYLTPEELSEKKGYMTSSGRPKYFTILGTTSNQLEVLPEPSGTYTATIIYYERIAALTSTNWLLTKHPDIYLFGALVAAEPYLKNDERDPMWTMKLDKALTDLRMQGEREMHSGSSLRMRAPVLG